MYHHAMRACGVALALVAVAGAGCKRASSPAAAPSASASSAKDPASAKAATRISCTALGCPPDTTAPPVDGGELVVWVDAEPAILNDLVEHDAWSRWILENQIIETLLQEDPWT